MTSYLFYPGCSLAGSARAYGESLATILGPLGIELHEIEDWNCCGASEYLTLSPLGGYALIGRNLALAERQRNGSDTLVAPCSLCYVNLAKTDHYARTDPELRDRLNAALGAADLSYTPGSVAVRHLLDVLVEDVGIDEVARHVTRPLTGLRVAPYLGCLVTRPDLDGRWAHREQPREFDRLLAALGADVVDFPLRTSCCGGHMTQISPDTGFELIRRIVDSADRLNADLLATVCPMCQMNIDAYQAEMNRHFHTSYRMPILFFTQLIGLAFGARPDEVGIGAELVSARRALDRIWTELPPVEAVAPDVTPAEGAATAAAPGGGTATSVATGPARRAKKPSGLPMPRPIDDEARR